MHTSRACTTDWFLVHIWHRRHWKAFVGGGGAVVHVFFPFNFPASGDLAGFLKNVTGFWKSGHLPVVVKKVCSHPLWGKGLTSSPPPCHVYHWACHIGTSKGPLGCCHLGLHWRSCPALKLLGVGPAGAPPPAPPLARGPLLLCAPAGRAAGHPRGAACPLRWLDRGPGDTRLLPGNIFYDGIVRFFFQD